MCSWVGGGYRSVQLDIGRYRGLQVNNGYRDVQGGRARIQGFASG